MEFFQIGQFESSILFLVLALNGNSFFIGKSLKNNQFQIVTFFVYKIIDPSPISL
jgi:hypothetical protein